MDQERKIKDNHVKHWNGKCKKNGTEMEFDRKTKRGKEGKKKNRKKRKERMKCGKKRKSMNRLEKKMKNWR